MQSENSHAKTSSSFLRRNMLVSVPLMSLWWGNEVAGILFHIFFTSLVTFLETDKNVKEAHWQLHIHFLTKPGSGGSVFGISVGFAPWEEWTTFPTHPNYIYEEKTCRNIASATVIAGQ